MEVEWYKLPCLNQRMRVWIVCFVLLFGAAELLQWIRQFSLPLPIFILGGAFLAILSNFDKLTHLPFHPDYEAPELVEEEAPAIPTSQVSPSAGRQPSQPSISFEIRKPFHPGD